MATHSAHLRRAPFATLQQFIRTPRAASHVCELCGASLSPEHYHLLEVEKRHVRCSCNPCAILFSGSSSQTYCRIPREVTRLEAFVMDDHEWESLLIPIKLAFIVHSSVLRKVIAQYPNPAGAMESSLDPGLWETIVERNPQLKSFTPDVEALLVNRIFDPPQYYRAPIDQCFKLVGLIRKHWRGLSGGTHVWEQINLFFRELDRLSRGPYA